MSDWTITQEPALRGYVVEWAAPEFFILSKRNRLFRSSTLEPPFTPIGDFPAPFWRSQIARFRLAQRALRFSFYNVLRLQNDALFLTFDRGLAVYSQGRFACLTGLARASRFLRGACALDADGTIFFGEYIGNHDREAIHVYRFVPGSERISVVHVFPAGTVCHVHGVYSDPYAAGLWCTTGDRGSECRISMTTDQFQTLETVGGGDESWRCVSLQFTQEGIYYASDAEFQQNYIYRIDRQSGKRSVLTEIEGPVYYSHATGQDLFFGVSAELCPSQQGRSAVLWCVSDQQKCSRLLAFEKDRLSVKYFLTGAFYFPCGPGLADEFFFHGIALCEADNRTFRARKRASPDEADRDAQEA